MIQRRKRSNNTCSCIKTTPKSTKKNKKTVIISLKPVRKARTKIKKPRFLSLSNTQMRLASDYPKNVVVKDHHHHNHESNDNMADIFAYDDGGPTPTTLTGLLNAAVSSSSYEVARENNSTTEASVISSLVRTALRNRERDSSDEKWVSIRVVSPAATCEEEVTSGFPVTAEGGGGDGCGGGGDCGGLCLKLDYEEVLNAWSGKGPFCVEAETESLQTVPDLHFDNFINHGGSCSSARNNGQWSVPEDDLKGHIDHTMEIGDTFFGINGWKLGLREASVLRYKAKRQSRLFSKRIRYEVRKLNAEKRPRIKGRFVRRRVDEEK